MTAPEQAPSASTSVKARPAAPASDALRTRADQVVELLNGKRAAEDFFAAGSGFKAEQVGRVQTMVRERFGAAVRVTAIEAHTPESGVVTLEMEQGQLRLRLGVETAPPHGVVAFDRAR